MDGRLSHLIQPSEDSFLTFRNYMYLINGPVDGLSGFEGHFFYDNRHLITNGNFVEIHFTFAFLFTLKPLAFTGTSFLPSARFSE